MLRSLNNVVRVIILALMLLYSTSARQYNTNINIPTFRRNDAWMFIDRMHLYPGHMTVNSRINFQVSNYK